ncbi:MAG: hypothetical protein ACFFA0_05620 [Promethearchaeota archaeon]
MKTETITGLIGEDHPNVKEVLKIAEEIMSKNKVLNIQNLYNLAKKRLKIPRTGLLSIIRFLINKKILIEGSKFSKETVLLNHIRKGVLNYIRANPGVHFSNLRRRALSEDKGSSGQLVWHLEMLLKFKYIKKIKIGNYTVFLPADQDKEIGKIFFFLRDRINNKIILLLIEDNFVKKSEIVKKINEKREDVYYRLNTLLSYEILIKTPDKDLTINPLIKEIISDIIKKSKLFVEKI